MYDLSILIPARNEMFLGKTIEDILSNIEGNTEIIAVLDGYTIEIPTIPDDDRIKLIAHCKSVGQRAACNEAARLSQAKYLMKVDAHCSFDKGFDVKMMNDMQPDWTMAPTMRNLHVFDWICEDGHTRYQGPSGPCTTKLPDGTACGKETKMEMKWIGKTNPQSNSYCFDSEPHFQYFREFSRRPQGQGNLTESMSLQGSCFMVTRDKWFELNICDESLGSWGSQGIEVACKTWLSGGKVIVTHKTWYAHCFRTQGQDFGFPYPNAGANNAKKLVKDLFFNNKWDKAIYPLSWLIDKFAPVPGWSDEDVAKLKGEKPKPLTKGCIYYTDNTLDEKIMTACQEQIKKSVNGHEIISCSLKPIEFGHKNIVLALERSPLTMFKQILKALENSTADIIFFCENDVLYPKDHFEFTPPDRNTFYYNENVWFWRFSDDHMLHYNARQLSGLCAYREALIIHYIERIKLCEEIGFSRNIGFEPMNHRRIKWDSWYNVDFWESAVPLVDIKHGKNLLRARWSQDEFRNKKAIKYWVEDTIDNVPGWNLKGVFN